MSLIPFIFDNYLPARGSLYGSEVYPREFVTWPLERGLLRSLSSPLGLLRSQLTQLDELAKNIHVGKDGFNVKLDVEHFKPEEITVKTVGNSIIIEAKHEERKDSESGYVSRQIVRRYDLPQGFKPEGVISNLSSDGVLEIKCPKSESLEGVLVREIPIQSTGPARLTEKKSDEKKCDEKKCDENKCDEKKCDEKKVETTNDKTEGKIEEKAEENAEQKK